MPSLWPFGGREDASSPKSFEKRLATLSDKIQRLQIRGDTLRTTHRRVKVLFTLYGFFIYVVAVLILVLVTGYEKWKAAEWTAIAGSPIAILAVRYLINLYFDWREDNVRIRLAKATGERDKVIKKLKDAMRYDSTKELLDKYGGSGSGGKASSPVRQKDSKGRSSGQKPSPVQHRTGFAPPPTANIPGRAPPAQNPVDARLMNPSGPRLPRHSIDNLPHNHAPDAGESFAPNAYANFDRPPAPANVTSQNQPARPGFLDRILDLIVGEDESAARNRIVLFCIKCKTVNGQAPPGTRSLAELGRWRCGACGEWNGVENDSDKILAQAKADIASENSQQMTAVSAPATIGDRYADQVADKMSHGSEDDEHGHEHT